MDLESIFEGQVLQTREEALAVLERKGSIRLLEAGPDVRIYWFGTASGEKVRLRLYNDGTCEIVA
ncbi:MAG TPA: hypothetical protein VIL66_01510 [Bacillota bacterium]